MSVREYIGARYVPIFANPAEWDNTRTYEPLTIVLHEGNSFTSRQFVPRGISIDNNVFWAETGNYSAQVEQYRREVLTFDARINDRVIGFDTVSDMKNSNRLYAGAICHTLGFYEVDDGGSAYYIVTNDAEPNEMDIIQLNNGLFAELQITEDYLTPEMLGAYGDSDHDDTNVLRKLFENYKKTGCKIILKNMATYTISDYIFNDYQTETKPLYIFGNNATIFFNNNVQRENVITLIHVYADVFVYDLVLRTELTQSGVGQHGEEISHMSKLWAISVRNGKNFNAVNCHSYNFDIFIAGTVSTNASYIGINSQITECSINNCLIGISQLHNTCFIQNCSINVSEYAESGEHCVYVTGNVLDWLIVSNSSFNGNSKIYSCIQAYTHIEYPSYNESKKRVIKINNCIFTSNGFLSTTEDCKLSANACTFNAITGNPNSIRSFNISTLSDEFKLEHNIHSHTMVIYTSYIEYFNHFLTLKSHAKFNCCTIRDLDSNVNDKKRAQGTYINCDLYEVVFGDADVIECILHYDKALPGNYIIAGAASKKCKLFNTIAYIGPLVPTLASIFYNSLSGTEFASVVNLTIINSPNSFTPTSDSKCFYSNVEFVTENWA